MRHAGKEYRSVGRSATSHKSLMKHSPHTVSFSIDHGQDPCASCCRLCGSLCLSGGSGCRSVLTMRTRYWNLLLLVLLLLTTSQLTMNVLYNKHNLSLFSIAHKVEDAIQHSQGLTVDASNKTVLNLSVKKKADVYKQEELTIPLLDSGNITTAAASDLKRSKVFDGSSGNNTTQQASNGGDDSVRAPRIGLKSLLSNELPSCPAVPPDLSGPIKVDLHNPAVIANEERHHPELRPGGHYLPPDCQARHRVAIIIPFRAREAHLAMWLRHMHPFLQKQQLDYTIFVVEQSGRTKFNRAQLMNVGALESSKLYPFQCYIFHDVDLLPEDDRNIYSCPQQPRHMSVAIDIMSYKLPYKAIFGGVNALSVEHFKKVNGFSNRFWGWGGEDDDMSNRINHHKLYISRYPANIARYKMLTHRKDTPNPQRFQTLYEGKKRFDKDGASFCKYKVLDLQLRKLYTWVHVELFKS